MRREREAFAQPFALAQTTFRVYANDLSRTPKSSCPVFASGYSSTTGKCQQQNKDGQQVFHIERKDSANRMKNQILEQQMQRKVTFPLLSHEKEALSSSLMKGLLKRKVAASYSPALHCSTIGASGLNFSVRNGKRWDPAAITT